VKAYIKYANDIDVNYHQIYAGSFSTEAPPVITWDKDFATRIEQAKKYTTAKITDGKYIDINLEAQVLSTFENGKLLDSYMVSSGKRGMETPKGQFSIHNKAPRVWSKKYGLFMPFWMAVASDGSFGIHELPEWPGGYKEGAAHLGIPVSHGCIRLGVGPAKTVYDWTEVGTPVVIY
jgi:lipoprotein-anchoring transpeptidase ErfK/SrfK